MIVSSKISINFILINTYELRKFVSMGCSSCKQKRENAPLSKEELEKLALKFERGAYVFLGIVSLLAIYGVYSLVKNLL
jgi:hypothetical protein